MGIATCPVACSTARPRCTATPRASRPTSCSPRPSWAAPPSPPSSATTRTGTPPVSPAHSTPRPRSSTTARRAPSPSRWSRPPPRPASFLRSNAAGQRSAYSLYRGTTFSYGAQFTYRGAELGQAVVFSGTTSYTDTDLDDGQGAPLELIRQTKVGGTLSTARYWYALDGRGDVVALTDSSGSVVDRYAYGVWGSLVSASEAVPRRLRYAGYWDDAELGWYWAGVRYYSPSLKRWLQPDPSQIDGVRTYVYVGDDPVDTTDPSGLYINPCGTIFGIFIAACNRTGTSHTIYMFLIGDDLNTLGDPNYDPTHIAVKGLALIDLASNLTLFVPFLGEADRAGAKVALTAGKRFLIRKVEGMSREEVEKLIARIVKTCARCFPAGTKVATPHGLKNIEALHIGDKVLSEDAQNGRVQAEPLTAVVADPVSDLIAVHLSDQSVITVTADHPFWVDSGAGLTRPGWMIAGHLQRGDRLRTLSSRDVQVIAVSHGAGHAKVFTLTVANTHTFFVGSDHVLVHNSNCVWPDNPEAMDELLGFRGERIPDGTAYPGRNKVVWRLSNMKIVYEEHPYHLNAPEWHRGPHWHIDYPGTSHERHLPGDHL